MNSEIDPYTTPAGPPPPGVVPNLEHPDSWAALTIGVMTTIAGIQVIAVAIRIFTKLHIMNVFNYEDYMLVLATIWSLIFDFVCVSPENRGFEHVWERTLASLPPFLLIENLVSIFWSIAMLFAKWAILVQLQRVFAAKKYSTIWWTSKILIYITSVVYITAMFICIFICTPREKIWNPDVPGHCLDLYETFLATAVVDAALNVGILALPVMGLRTLKISKKQKLVVGVMFSGNILALACAIGRITATVKLITSTDQTRDIAPEAYWAAAETSFLVLATVYPTMPRFWQWCRGRDPTQQQLPIAGAAGGATVAPTMPSLKPVRTRDSVAGTTLASEAAGAYMKEESYAMAPLGNTSMASVSSGWTGRGERGRRSDEGGILRTVEVEVSSMV